MIDLFSAVHGNNADQIRVWIKGGQVDINQKDKQYGATALHWAALENKVEVAKVLLRHRANPNAPCNFTNATPLHWAVEGNNMPMVKLLCQYYADVTARESVKEMTPLEVAESQQYTDVAMVLRKQLEKVKPSGKHTHPPEPSKRPNAVHSAPGGDRMTAPAPLSQTALNSVAPVHTLTANRYPASENGHLKTSPSSIADTGTLYSEMPPQVNNMISPSHSLPSQTNTMSHVADPEELNGLRRQVAQLNKELTTYKTKIAEQGNLEAQVLQLTQTNQNLQNAVAAKDQQLKELEDKQSNPAVVEYLNEQVRNMQNSLHATRSELHNAQNSLQRMTEHYEVTKLELEHALKERDESDMQNNELNKKLGETMIHLTALEGEKQDLEIDHQAQLGDHNRKLSEVEAERDQLAVQSTATGEIKAQFSIVASEKGALEDLLKRTNLELQQKSDQLFKAQSTLGIEERCNQHHKAQLLSLQREKRELEIALKALVPNRDIPTHLHLPRGADMSAQTDIDLTEFTRIENKAKQPPEVVYKQIPQAEPPPMPSYTQQQQQQPPLVKSQYNRGGVGSDSTGVAAPLPVTGSAVTRSAPPQKYGNNNTPTTTNKNGTAQGTVAITPLPVQTAAHYATKEPNVASPTSSRLGTPHLPYGHTNTFSAVPSTQTVGSSSSVSLKGDQPASPPSLAASVQTGATMYHGDKEVLPLHDQHLEELRRALKQQYDY